MTIKTLTKTVVTTIETTSFPIEGSDSLVLVHVKYEKGARQFIVMQKQAYKKAKTVDAIKHYQFHPRVMNKKGEKKYSARFVILTNKQYEHILDGSYDWYRIDEGVVEKFIKTGFGKPLPNDWKIVGVGDTMFFFNLDETLIERPYKDSFLNRDYDIHKLIMQEKDNPDITILNDRWGSPIYYVPGNGQTINLSITLPEGRYTEMMAGSCWERHQFLDKYTSLGKYKRDEPVYEDD